MNHPTGGVLIKELSSIANIQRIDIQQETELSRMTSGYYGRTVTVSGDFSKRLHVVYLLLRQVNRASGVASTQPLALPTSSQTRPTCVNIYR
jgi:hypothetical protein